MCHSQLLNELTRKLDDRVCRLHVEPDEDRRIEARSTRPRSISRFFRSPSPRRRRVGSRATASRGPVVQRDGRAQGGSTGTPPVEVRAVVPEQLQEQNVDEVDQERVFPPRRRQARILLRFRRGLTVEVSGWQAGRGSLRLRARCPDPDETDRGRERECARRAWRWPASPACCTPRRRRRAAHPRGPDGRSRAGASPAGPRRTSPGPAAPDLRTRPDQGAKVLALVCPRFLPLDAGEADAPVVEDPPGELAFLGGDEDGFVRRPNDSRSSDREQYGTFDSSQPPGSAAIQSRRTSSSVRVRASTSARP